MRLCLLAAVLAVAGCADLPARRERTLVFLLMGQSNMSGRGAPGEALAGELDPDPRILVYGNDEATRIAAEPLDVDRGQVDAVSADRQAGVGPGLAFAKALVAARPGAKVLLVPCAKGGSTIAQWATNPSRSSLYGSCVARAHAAERSGRVAGALWYQGESDAASEDLVVAWPSKFAQLVADLRRDLSLGDLCIIAVSIGDAPANGPYAARFPAWRAMQAAQTSLHLPNAYVVPAAGLPRNADELHLSTAGQIDLGRRLAAAWLQANPPR